MVGIVIALVVAVVGSLIAMAMFVLVGLPWWTAPVVVAVMFAGLMVRNYWRLKNTYPYR